VLVDYPEEKFGGFLPSPLLRPVHPEEIAPMAGCSGRRSAIPTTQPRSYASQLPYPDPADLDA
jgi:hypothetical protein